MFDPSLALRIVRESPVISFDTETSGLDKNAKVVGWVIYAPEAGATYTPVRHEGGGNILNVDEFEAELAAAFADRARMGFRTIGHNIAFDLRMSRRHGVVIRGVLEDTMINEGLINDYAPSFSLESCAEENGVTPKKAMPMYMHLAQRFGGVADKKQMSNFWRLPGDDTMAIEYAEGDAITTYDLWECQQSKIMDKGLELVHQLECRLIPHIDQMNAIGMRVDQSKAETIMAEIDGKIADAMGVFPSGFNVNSSKQVEQLFLDNGISDFATTAKGAPSFRVEWLESRDLGRAILKVRQLRKARDSFITPLIDTYNVNGRIHAQLNQSKSDEYGAIGGRLSCSDPNMQAFPKRNKAVGKVVRQLIVPDFGDIYESDFSQQEPRLFTHYSECEALIKGYTAVPFVDIHTVASQIMGVPRDYAKRLGLGILTGLGYKGLAEKNNMTLADATAAHKKYMAAFHEIKQFQNDAKATAQARGYIRTLLGRIATFPDRSKAYTAVSRIIQGSGADHTKTALLDACEFCEAHGGRIQMLMTIHDSFMYQTDNDDLAKELQGVIENAAPKLGVIIPIPTETGKGKNWAEASYGDK